MYVTDTHSFLWFLADDNKLGKKAREVFIYCDKGETTINITSIVLMEALFICERKKVGLEFKKVLEKVQKTINYPVYPLDAGIVSMCQKLKQFSDPHDRIIVATSQILNAGLITKDDNIKKSKLVETIW
jgi:PIN domain nuclease of toxin-antitoxin system